MKRFIFLLIYNLLLPVFLLISIPGYLIKMKKRGGFGTGLSERFGIYRKPASQEPQGGLYVHAVSVGETFIALKFIREWCKTHSEPVILATSTATGRYRASRLHSKKKYRIIALSPVCADRRYSHRPAGSCA